MIRSSLYDYFAKLSDPLKQEDSKKLSLRTKRLKAGWDNNFLLKILKI